MSIQQLREQRAAKAKAANEFVNRADYNPATDNDQFDAMIAEVTALDDRIARMQAAIDLSGEQAMDADTHERRARAQRDDDTRAPVWGLLGRWLAHGERALSADEVQRVFATMSTGTDSQGGYTVQQEVAASVLDALAAYGGVREVATILRTAQGNQINFPTSDGTSEEGEIVTENSTVSDADPSFGTKALTVYKFSSKGVAVPIELLADSAVDIEGFVRDRLRTRLGRITNKKFTIGSGSGEPMGIATAAAVGKTGTTGKTTSADYDDLVDLVHSVDPAYRQADGVGWMLHDDCLRNLRKLKDLDGKPIFNPGWSDGTPGAAPDRILGWPVTINQHMAVPAANAKSILFGQLSLYHVRDVLDVQMYRFTDSAYTRKGQVGFLAFMRSGGNLLDAGGGVKAYKNSAT